jgi:alanine racemase
MVKADAYGVGVLPVVRALQLVDPWGYGVATVEEGAQLRTAGVKRPVVVFTPARPELLDRYRGHDLRAVLDDPAVIRQWPLPFHLEVDTGMGRAGIRWDDAERLAGARSPWLEGVFTHFHSADVSPSSVAGQWMRFETALARLGERPPLVHAANSAAIWRLGQRLDLARPGIFLYGGRAGGDLPRPAPVVGLRARVVSVRALPAGESVSYGAEWTAPSDTAIATLGIGYADGLFRGLAGKGCVLLRGRRCPIVGRITMDMTMVDVGALDRVAPGDVATLIGSDGREEIGLDEFASRSGTISYEILTRLGQRLPREYRGGR